MNRVKLVEMLEREGVRRDTFAINVGNDIPLRVDLDERLVLEIENGGWVVYYSERGTRTGLRWYETEDEACRALLEKLLRDPATRTPAVGPPLHYLSLFEELLDGSLGVDEFVRRFVARWRSHAEAGVRTGDLIDHVMTSVDCYRPDPTPGDPFEIGEEELRADVRAALSQLRGGE